MCFERAMAFQPSGETALWLGAAYAQVGRDADARAAFLRASHSPRPQTALLAQQWLRAASGRQVPVLEEEMIPEAYAYVVSWYNPRFFFQAEDGIRDYKVTGVQTCALPI